MRCSSKDWRALLQPKKESKKGDNGRLLICAGSIQYHGSLILAIRAAVRFCDLVYVYCPNERGDNAALVRKLKASTSNIIVLTSSRSLLQFLPRMDAILAGPGWDVNKANALLLALLLKTKKSMVLDAGALMLVSEQPALRRLLHSSCILTPHRGEFEMLFGKKASGHSILEAAKSCGCILLAKGPTDYVSDGHSLRLNTMHQVGMTKGGSGDALAGLCAAILSCGNIPFLCACASAFLLGSCGVRLSRRMGTHYSSSDLVEELPPCARALERRH